MSKTKTRKVIRKQQKGKESNKKETKLTKGKRKQCKRKEGSVCETIAKYNSETQRTELSLNAT
jgi:hypothetical protein